MRRQLAPRVRSPRAGRVDRDLSGRDDIGRLAPRAGRVDRVIGALAGRQRGVVARWQLLGAGLSADALDHRVETGRLHPIHRGVYAVGHASLDARGLALAAVLAAGDGALLGHRSAAVHHGWLPPDDGPVDVVRPGRSHRSIPGVRLHRPTILSPTDVAHRAGVPVTAPARTLLDLSATASARDLERAVTEARLARAVDEQQLLRRAAGRPGARRLRALLDDGPSLTRSEAERRLLALLARAGLPRPATNARVGRYEVDALWPAHRLIVEVDGYAFHGSRAAFERDRVRDTELSLAGYEVHHVTWRQLTETPEAVVARLAAALAQRPTIRIPASS